jgi:hypothetical protein
MLGFGADIPVSKLCGQDLVQVCFGIHEIILRLGVDDFVAIYHRSLFEQDNQRISGGDVSGELLSCLGEVVTDCITLDSRSAVLKFANSVSFKLLERADEFEAFNFRIAGKEYVV